MLAMIEVTYKGQQAIATMPREKYLEVVEAMPQFNLSTWKESDAKPPAVYVYGKYLVDLTAQGAYLLANGIDYEVKNFKATYKAAQQSLPTGSSIAIHVHIPNVGLLAINEVEVLEDACTDSLQSRLNAGWRIIAVCPPNSVRRPDYIIGRTTS
jgi:hypothetical protein